MNLENLAKIHQKVLSVEGYVKMYCELICKKLMELKAVMNDLMQEVDAKRNMDCYGSLAGPCNEKDIKDMTADELLERAIQIQCQLETCR